MSTWVPPTSIPALNDGDPLVAKSLKDLVASLQAFLNGEIGNPNINVDLDPTEKIAYAKLDLAGQIQPGDIAGVLLSTFSSLKVRAQASPNNTVFVEAGLYPSIDALATRSFAGGSSGAFANTSGAGQRRIDVLTINDAGTLGITSGVEGGAPVAPDYPADEIPLAEIYIRFNGVGVIIRNTDNTVDSYILQDVRPIMDFPGVPNNSITYDKIAMGHVVDWREVPGANTDLGDPGTSFATMTDMTRTFSSPLSFMGFLVIFQAPITIRQASGAGANWPAAEIRLMSSRDGAAYTEIARTIIDYRTDVAVGVGNFARTIPVTLIGSEFNAVSPTSMAFKVEWRRLNGGTPGTPSVEQNGNTLGPRVLTFWGFNKPSLLV